MLTGVIDGIDCAGRVLAAANAALPVPADPLARLWHAVTVLREHRGDGHAAAHRALEDATDLAAARPWAALGPDDIAGLLAVLGPVARACAADLPYPNPVGMRAPDTAPAAP
jgi:Helix-turn-helix family